MLSGLWLPIVTPLTTRGAVDLPSLERLGDRLLHDGVTGLVALGTTGEPATLTARERQGVIDVCAEVTARVGRPLMVGAGSNCTRSTIAEVSELCARVQPAALLVVVPYYTRPAEAAVVRHYEAVAAESPVPLVVYNIPYRTGRGLGASALLELAAMPNIIGIKQAVGALDHDTLEVLRRCPADFGVLAGDDAYLAPTILMGGAGAIAAAAHVCTPTFVELVAAALAGDVVHTRRLASKLAPVVDAGFAEPNPALWKAALAANGEIASAALRMPMTAAGQAATTAIVAAIAAA